jgi:hypothetical protein
MVAVRVGWLGAAGAGLARAHDDGHTHVFDLNFDEIALRLQRSPAAVRHKA